MAHNITVTFLGTTSGGGPTETRNCSSLVLDPLGDGSYWMVDCAEGTARQAAMQPWKDERKVKINRVTKIFITHMHADHTMGLLPLLRSLLGIPHPNAHSRHTARSSTSAQPYTPMNAIFARPLVEIYGPRGLRRFLRTLFAATHTHSQHQYAVHELLFPGEQPSDSAIPDPYSFTVAGWDSHVESEAAGRDIACDANGFWRGIVDLPSGGGGVAGGRPYGEKRRVVVDAGPIEHRDPCIGYVFREVARRDVPPALEPPPRTIMILGDTYDPSAMLPLVHGRRVSLLVHEATDAYMPRAVDPQERTGKNRTPESVRANAIARGHGTPAMAGQFATLIGAERLVLNHIGARFPAPNTQSNSSHPMERFRRACVAEIEQQATNAWSPPSRGVTVHTRAVAAHDFMRVVVHPYPVPEVIEVMDVDPSPVASGDEVEVAAEAVSERAAEDIQRWRERAGKEGREYAHVPGMGGGRDVERTHSDSAASRRKRERESGSGRRGMSSVAGQASGSTPALVSGERGAGRRGRGQRGDKRGRWDG